jgi:hypothetical protein
MQSLDPAKQVVVLRIQYTGTIMERLHQYIITLPVVIFCILIQDLGKIKTHSSFIGSFFFSNRGNCYFYGQLSAITSMSQTLNLPDSINPSLIDNQKISYNLSAWMGGYDEQDDNAQVSLTFINQTNQQVGNTITIGPVLAAERRNITSLIFHQTNGLVPSGTRSFMITVTMTVVMGPDNDGLSDNIALYLYYS